MSTSLYLTRPQDHYLILMESNPVIQQQVWRDSMVKQLGDQIKQRKEEDEAEKARADEEQKL